MNARRDEAPDTSDSRRVNRPRFHGRSIQAREEVTTKMSVNREVKQKAVDELTEILSRAKAAIVANYSGLNVASVMEIRREFRKAGVEYKVVKNTLMKRALAGSQREKLSEVFTGTTAVAFKFDDETSRLGKAAKDIAKKFEKFKVKAGFVENDVLIGEKAMDTMAALPTLDEARSQLLGVLNAPLGKLLAQMNAPAQNIIGVIKAKEEKDSKEAAPAA
jgi:large subunit ribosomal protein L10